MIFKRLVFTIVAVLCLLTSWIEFIIRLIILPIVYIFTGHLTIQFEKGLYLWNFTEWTKNKLKV